jgi:cell division protein FtsB
MKRAAWPGRWIKLILLAVMAAAVVAAIFGDKGLMHLYDLRRQRDEIHRENQRLEQQNREMQREVELLLHDLRYLDRIAREELGLIGPNEIIFRFSQAPAATGSAATSPEKKLSTSP